MPWERHVECERIAQHKLSVEPDTLVSRRDEARRFRIEEPRACENAVGNELEVAPGGDPIENTEINSSWFLRVLCASVVKIFLPKGQEISAH
jgi:hypothetical protein